MSLIWWIIIITTIAGVFGTGLGGLIGAILRRDSSKVVSLLLAFAGGVMMAVVFFDLVPGAIRPEGSEEQMSIWLVVAGIMFGYGVIYVLNYVIDKSTNPEVMHIDDEHPLTADALEELIHADHYKAHVDKKESPKYNYDLFIAGVVMACAIALHNLPEGMVIGASYARNPEALTALGGSGFVIAIVIGLHNIPEGMSVSVPLISGGMSKVKAVALTALSGAPTVIGAIIGFYLGVISPIWLCASLSFASGAMLYVVLGELLPESYLMWKSKAPSISAIVGVLIGLLIVAA